MMVKLLLLLIAISLCVFQVSSTCSTSGNDATIYPTDYTTAIAGQATYYGVYSNGGACTLDPTPPAGTASIIKTTVAIADNIWAGSKACGMCVNITFSGTGSGASHPTGSYIAFVNNECPSCTSNGIDLGLSGDGVWDMTWKAIPCPVGTTGIQFWFQGANDYYIKLQIRNTRYPVQAVSILQNGLYHALVRTADNFFTAGSSVTFPLTFPLGVQVTASTGDVIADSIPSLTNSAVLQGTAQFADCSGSSSSSGSAATTTTGAKTTTTTTTGAKTTTTTTTGAKTTTTTTTGTKTSTTTTTGASSTTGSSTATQTYVYQDAVNTAAFSDWSWGTVNAKVTSPVYAGTYSYGFTPGAWTAAYFECATTGCINPSTIASIQFQIYSPVALTTQISFALVQNSAGVGSKALNAYITSGVPAGTWTKCTIPLSGFAAGSYEGFWFQDATGGAQSQIFFDNIVVIGK